jgi:hypothetical protein
MGDLSSSYFIIDHLDLGAFPAIHEKVLAIECYNLAGGMPVKGRDRRIITQYRHREHAAKILYPTQTSAGYPLYHVNNFDRRD